MKKILNIQALRTCAFLGIFLSHANYYFGWPAFGVSIFFVMSGYLMYYNHQKFVFDISLMNCIKFSWARIKKLYKLHIITMVFAIILEFVYMTKENIDISSKTGGIVRDVLLNISLTQSWVPDRQINVSLNGVAWYLSTIFFYMPYIL